MHLVGPVFVFEIPADLFHKIRRERIGIMRKIQPQRLIARFRGLRCSNLSVFKHGIDDQIAPVQRPVGMIDGRIINRRLGESRNQRGFIEREQPGRLAEVVFRRGFKSINAMAQINLVRVERENLFFGEPAFDLDCEQRFFNFAMVGAVRREKQITRQLHGECGSALCALA